MSHVFVAYSHGDEPFVSRLSADLRAAGIDLWYDEEKITAGQNWQDSITKARDQASIVLYVSTQSSNASEWVRREIDAALTMNIPVLPLVVGEPPIAPDLHALQWIDFRPNYEEGLQHLVAALARIVAQGKPLPPLLPKSKGYVFISYAEEDSEFVASLRDFLKDRGYGYWDYQESDRDYHRQFSLELEEIIQGAVATLSILSPHWKRSKWTPKEYIFSGEMNIPVFLLRFRETPPTLVLAGEPYIDFVADVSQGFAKLDHELQRKGLA